MFKFYKYDIVSYRYLILLVYLLYKRWIYSLKTFLFGSYVNKEMVEIETQCGIDLVCIIFEYS